MIKLIYSKFGTFVKYCLIGSLGTFIDVLTLYFLVEYFGSPLLIATTLAFLLAATNNFIFNKLWTFKNKSKNYKKLYIKFLIISCIGLLLTNISMYFQVEILSFWYVYAKLITSLIVLIWNFLGNKYWTFKTENHLATKIDKYEFDISIVIPAFNEEKRIEKTILTIYHYLQEKKINAEIIIINDGSTDNTYNLLDSKKNKFNNFSIISLERNRGKGGAVKEGVELARGEYILMTDADNSTPISELSKLLKEAKKGYPIVIGSRYLNNNSVKIKQPLLRIIIGRIGNFLIQLFLVDNIKDTQCGFKLFENFVAKKIFSKQKIKKWGFDMEVLAIADLFNFKIKEVSVNWFDSSDSRIRPIRDALKTFLELIYIKFNLMTGRYDD